MRTLGGVHASEIASSERARPRLPFIIVESTLLTYRHSRFGFCTDQYRRDRIRRALARGLPSVLCVVRLIEVDLSSETHFGMTSADEPQESPRKRRKDSNQRAQHFLHTAKLLDTCIAGQKLLFLEHSWTVAQALKVITVYILRWHPSQTVSQLSVRDVHRKDQCTGAWGSPYIQRSPCH